MPLEEIGPNSKGLNKLRFVPGTATPDSSDALEPYLGVDEQVLVDIINPLVDLVTAGVTVAAPTLAFLSASVNDTELGNGAIVWVVSRRRFFQLEKTSAAALVDGEVAVTKSGNGRWVSLDATTSFTWSQVGTWFVDPANVTNLASDDNDGLSALTPLHTAEELQRRVGKLGRTLNGGNPVTVNLMSSTANLSFMGVKGFISVVGTRTQVFAGTLTSFVALNRNAGTPNLIQAAGLAGTWTALGGVANRIRLTSGATLGTAFIMVDDGGANHQAETTPFVDANGNSFNPAGTENFVVETMSIISSIVTDGVGQLELVVNVTDSQITNVTGAAAAGEIAISGCKVTSFVNGVTLIVFTGCWFGNTVQAFNGSCTFVNACGCTNDVKTGAGFGASAISAIVVGQDTFMLDAEIFCTTPLNNRIGPVFFKNTTKILVDTSLSASAQTQGGAFEQTGVIYGATTLANSPGVILGKGARVDLNSFVNTFTTAGVNYQFGSASKTHAQLPFVDQFNVGAGPVANSNMAQVL